MNKNKHTSKTELAEWSKEDNDNNQGEGGEGGKEEWSNQGTGINDPRTRTTGWGLTVGKGGKRSNRGKLGQL